MSWSSPGVSGRMKSRLIRTLLFVLLGGASAAKNLSAPVVVPTSQLFFGDDGLWSTFIVEVGTPPQPLSLLPGTSAFAGNALWAVLSEGCWQANPGLPNCADSRGGLFTRNQSTSWSTQRLPGGGLLELPTYEEHALGLDGAAYYGFDVVTLGLPGGNLPVLQNQLVAGIATDNYYIGSLGLSPISFNITGPDEPVPSILGALRNNSAIPSLSWAYTAGAFYKSPPFYGSLILGGYDETKFDHSNTLADIAFSGDTSRDLQVQLQSITYDTIGAAPLSTSSFYVFIDSMVSQMWLPENVCQSFEQAFNLTYNSTMELYLLDKAVHDKLLAQNPTFSFTLGDALGRSVQITLPYAAFDLNVTLPIVSSPTRYFPLKRAQNSTQYTLGRVFLQEAYIVADYDRRNFSISQAVSPPSAVTPVIKPICAPGDEAACGGGRHGLSTGAIAGIAVGAAAMVIVMVVMAVWLLRRHRRRATVAASAVQESEKPETSSDEKARPEVELENSEAALYELDPRNAFRPELGGTEKKQKPMPSGAVHELGTRDAAAFELEAPVK